MKVILFPINQTFDYDYPITHGLFESWTWVSFLMVILILLISVFLYKKNRLLSFGILWFFITISPQSLVPRPNVIFEHRVYLSAFGIILVWTILLFYLAGKVRIFNNSGKPLPHFWSSFASLASVLLIVQVILFTWLTWQRNKVWETELSLWTDCLEKAPGSARSWSSLGVAWHKNRDYHKATFHFDQALKIFPQYLQALNNRGASRMAMGDYTAALADFNEVIALNRDFLEAWANRGIARRKMQQYAPAIADFTRAISMDSLQSGLYLQRGFTYWLTGRKDSAVADMKRAVRLGNQDAEKILTNILKE